MGMRLRSGAAFLAVLWALGGSASGGLVYSTSFEADEGFVAGQVLDGQGGFYAFGGVSAAAASVTDARAVTGSQSVIVDGSLFEPYDFFYGGFWEQPLNLSGLRSLDVSADVAFFPGVTGSPDDDISAGFAIYDGSGGYLAGLIISADGRFIGDNYDFETVEAQGTLDEFHALRISIDFQASTISYFADGNLLGTLGLTGPVDGTLSGVDLWMGSLAPTASSAGFDNLSIRATAVPEPTSIVMLGLGATLLGAGVKAGRPSRARRDS